MTSDRTAAGPAADERGRARPAPGTPGRPGGNRLPRATADHTATEPGSRRDPAGLPEAGDAPDRARPGTDTASPRGTKPERRTVARQDADAVSTHAPAGSAGASGPAETGMPDRGAGTARAPRRRMARIAAASFTGTAIEYYDFCVYGTAAALVFGPLFFPQFSPTAGLLAAFGAFAAGFLARPLGSVLFGHVGDRFGRRTVLLASLLTTGLATVGVGLLPGYGTIGAAAPALLVLLRFVQGLGLGGEWTGAVLLASEHAPPRRRGLWAGFPQTGPALGYLLANGLMLAMSAGLSDQAFRDWGWRVPFWAAGVLILVGYALRVSLGETPEFRRLAASGTTGKGLAPAPFAEIVRAHWRRVLLVAGATAGAYALYYGVIAWSLAHATGRLGMDRTTMLACLMVAVAVMGAATPLAAALGDRWGRRRMSLAGYAAMTVCIGPYLLVLRTGDPRWIAAGAAVTLLALVTMLGVQGAYLPELFAARVRCTGTAVSYNLGAVLGGALAPLAATRIAASAGTDGAPWAVAGYLAAVCVVSLLCVLRLPDTRVTGPG